MLQEGSYFTPLFYAMFQDVNGSINTLSNKN